MKAKEFAAMKPEELTAKIAELKKIDYEKVFVDQFRTKDGKKTFIGTGNVMESLVLLAKQTGDRELLAIKDRLVADVIAAQAPDEFRANVAVLMNITPDHLDRYEHCMQNYVDAKFRILQNQEPEDAFVYWNDDPIIQVELPKHKHGKLYPFAEDKKDNLAAYTQEHKIVFTEPVAFNMEQEELSLTGKHNLYNSMAAGISANVAGIHKETIREALKTFKGVEHRLEKVASIDGVEYINDSKATNVNSCWYALQSMTTKTVLILGGKDKGNDYNEIADLVQQKCSALVFLGADNSKLHAFFDRFGLPTADARSMQECIAAARSFATQGQTVLLSPCCASFDLFKSYEDRGTQFKNEVLKIKQTTL